MPQPLIAKGKFGLGKNGNLIKHQFEPEEEKVSIGETSISIIRGDLENEMPLPDSLRSLLSLLRALVGTGAADISGYDTVLGGGADGWFLNLKPRNDDGALRLEGCGVVLGKVIFETAARERREIEFLPPS